MLKRNPDFDIINIDDESPFEAVILLRPSSEIVMNQARPTHSTMFVRFDKFHEMRVNAEKIRSAILEGDIRLAKELIEASNDIYNNSTFEDEFTLLHFSVNEGLDEISEILLDKGADVNARDKWSRSPLFYAKDVKLAQLLIEKGANINLTDCNNKSAIFDAIVNRNLELVKLLLEKGAKLDIKDRLFEQTPLMRSIEIHGENHEITDLIREALEKRERKIAKAANAQDAKGAKVLANEEENQAIQDIEASKPKGYWVNRILKERQAKEKQEEAVKREKSFEGFLLI